MLSLCDQTKIVMRGGAVFNRSAIYNWLVVYDNPIGLN